MRFLAGALRALLRWLWLPLGLPLRALEALVLAPYRRHFARRVKKHWPLRAAVKCLLFAGACWGLALLPAHGVLADALELAGLSRSFDLLAYCVALPLGVCWAFSMAQMRGPVLASAWDSLLLSILPLAAAWGALWWLLPQWGFRPLDASFWEAVDECFFRGAGACAYRPPTDFWIACGVLLGGCAGACAMAVRARSFAVRVRRVLGWPLRLLVRYGLAWALLGGVGWAFVNDHWPGSDLDGLRGEIEWLARELAREHAGIELPEVLERLGEGRHRILLPWWMWAGAGAAALLVGALLSRLLLGPAALGLSWAAARLSHAAGRAVDRQLAWLRDEAAARRALRAARAEAGPASEDEMEAVRRAAGDAGEREGQGHGQGQGEDGAPAAPAAPAVPAAEEEPAPGAVGEVLRETVSEGLAKGGVAGVAGVAEGEAEERLREHQESEERMRKLWELDDEAENRAKLQEAEAYAEANEDMSYIDSMGWDFGAGQVAQPGSAQEAAAAGPTQAAPPPEGSAAADPEPAEERAPPADGHGDPAAADPEPADPEPVQDALPGKGYRDSVRAGPAPPAPERGPPGKGHGDPVAAEPAQETRPGKGYRDSVRAGPAPSALERGPPGKGHGDPVAADPEPAQETRPGKGYRDSVRAGPAPEGAGHWRSRPYEDEGGVRVFEEPEVASEDHEGPVRSDLLKGSASVAADVSELEGLGEGGEGGGGDAPPAPPEAPSAPSEPPEPLEAPPAPVALSEEPVVPFASPSPSPPSPPSPEVSEGNLAEADDPEMFSARMFAGDELTSEEALRRALMDPEEGEKGLSPEGVAWVRIVRKRLAEGAREGGGGG